MNKTRRMHTCEQVLQDSVACSMLWLLQQSPLEVEHENADHEEWSQHQEHNDDKDNEALKRAPGRVLAAESRDSSHHGQLLGHGHALVKAENGLILHHACQ
jgi:hypothetical protein